MVDPSKINVEACTICQEEFGAGPCEITAIDAHKAYGLKRIYFCEKCNKVLAHFHAGYKKEMLKALDAPARKFIERFIEDNANIKG